MSYPTAYRAASAAYTATVSALDAAIAATEQRAAAVALSKVLGEMARRERAYADPAASAFRARRPSIPTRTPSGRGRPGKYPLPGHPFAPSGDGLAPSGQNRPDGYRENLGPNGWSPSPTGCNYSLPKPLLCGPYLIEGASECLGGQGGDCVNTPAAAAQLDTRLQQGARSISRVRVYLDSVTFNRIRRFYEWKWTIPVGGQPFPKPRSSGPKAAKAIPPEALAAPKPERPTNSVAGPLPKASGGGRQPPNKVQHTLEAPPPGTKEGKFRPKLGAFGALARAAFSAATEAIDVVEALHDALPKDKKCKAPPRARSGIQYGKTRACSPFRQAAAVYRAIGNMSKDEAEKWMSDAIWNLAQNEAEDQAIGRLARAANAKLPGVTIGPAL